MEWIFGANWNLGFDILMCSGEGGGDIDALCTFVPNLLANLNRRGNSASTGSSRAEMPPNSNDVATP